MILGKASRTRTNIEPRNGGLACDISKATATRSCPRKDDNDSATSFVFCPGKKVFLLITTLATKELCNYTLRHCSYLSKCQLGKLQFLVWLAELFRQMWGWREMALPKQKLYDWASRGNTQLWRCRGWHSEGILQYPGLSPTPSDHQGERRRRTLGQNSVHCHRRCHWGDFWLNKHEKICITQNILLLGCNKYTYTYNAPKLAFTGGLCSNIYLQEEIVHQKKLPNRASSLPSSLVKI